MKLWGIGSALLSGAILAISRDTGQFGWLVLIGPVPLLIYALRAATLRGLLSLGFLCGLMAEVGPMFYYGHILPLIYGMAAYQALMFGLSVLFFRALYRRFPAGVAILGYAAMSAGVEYLYGLVSPNGSFGALGYAMVDVLPLLQTASVAGIAGLTFLAAIIPAGLAVLIAKPREISALAVWTVPVLAALGFGFWQLAQPLGPPLRIALLSDDRQSGRVFNHPEAGTDIATGFSQQIAEAATENPAAIVIPEKILATGTTLTAPKGIVIVAGLDGPAPVGGRLNIAALYAPDAPAQAYLKKRMVPGLEREYRPGRTELITHIGGQKVGIAICKDMDFAGDLRLYGQRDVALVLVPAWDFDKDAYLHGRMAVVRGVENGFALARSASQGLMTLSDSKGRIVAEKRTIQGPSALIGNLPTGKGGTIYSRIGDVFAQVTTALWAGLLVLLIWRRKAK